MTHLTLKTELKFNSEQDKIALIEALKAERTAFNICSNIHFHSKAKNSIVELHKNCYSQIRSSNPEIKSQLIIKAENNCLSAYKSAKSNKHKLTKAILKKRLSTHYDARLSSYVDGVFRLTTLSRRIEAFPVMYDRFKTYLDKYKFGDILLYSDGIKVFVCLTFNVYEPTITPKLALGVDLGIRRFATTSEGKLIISKKYNREKRKLRHLKSELKSKGTKSAKRKLKKLRRKEYNHNNNFNHLLANEILRTKANLIVIEDLDVKQLKSKKSRYQNKNRISQVSFAKLRFLLTYKAGLVNKQVVCVSPYYTSQIDHASGKLSGDRKGIRFYSESGLIYDADVNAAVNIGYRSNLPISYKNVLDGQGFVSNPYV